MVSGEKFRRSLGTTKNIYKFTYRFIRDADLTTLYDDMRPETEDGVRSLYFQPPDTTALPRAVWLTELDRIEEKDSAPKGDLGPSYRIDISLEDVVA